MLFSPSTKGFYSREIHGQNIPGDVVEITSARYHELLREQSEGKTISSDSDGMPILLSPPAPTFAEKVAAFRVAVQSHLDAQAVTMGYDSIAAAVTYAEEPSVPKFQLEGRSLRAWRSRVWDACYALLSKVESGEAIEPTLEEVLAAMPAFAMLETTE